MNMITVGKIQIGMVLAALGFAAGCASATTDADGSVGEAEGALVTTVPAGTKLSCSMSGEHGTGRRRATLMVDDDFRTCYREPEPGNPVAASSIPSCYEVGNRIGCEEIITP